MKEFCSSFFYPVPLELTDIFMEDQKRRFSNEFITFIKSESNKQIKVRSVANNNSEITYIWIEFKVNESIRFFAIELSFENLSNILEYTIKNDLFLTYSTDFFCFLDSKGAITTINNHGVEKIGYDSVDELIGEKFDFFLQSPSTTELFMDDKALQNANYKNELYIKKKDGSEFIGLGSIIPFKNENGLIVQYLVSVTDITEQVTLLSDAMISSLELVSANQNLKQTQATLLKKEKMASIGQLGAGIAHEINNPLGYLKNNNQVLQDYVKSMKDFVKLAKDKGILKNKELEKKYNALDLDYIFEEIPAITKEMNEGLNHIEKIVKGIKSFSGKENSSGWNYLDINKSINDMLLISKNEYKYHIEIELNFSEIPRILCDSVEIDQALLAVFMNAIEAIRENNKDGKGKILIITRNGKEGIYIEFIDDGPGISKEDLTKVFDPFFSGRRDGLGTGLGLSIAQDIIEKKHKGSLEINSNQNGTDVIIFLPIIETISYGDDDET